ncbi:unnamed protein product [Arabidopsis lyrata]|uniref:Uncharacterized protein n=1 Tax=Arabidopsis lyrata subsp. lyrata TaxID=81972 RepID=D7MVR7_ARALL|nr:uncharacterized protein LOC9299182 [Arabidopsis lyrata subsp. lyrata]EFH39365.1 hypothetical protein ARALYDRAFT_920363 [Arabidopsis lyrata subsp. lyrata]CAH8257653.1 unnamed protein product [Arabidopsis lyrata]|eukprot:XP_002863106.1 uncharacterized protein LOC9299182 [Arabidopsis lyrata subsp. lyrata]
MEFFNQAKAVRMRNVHDKYLTADEDEETVTQDRNGSDKRARWTVEPVRGSFEVIRLRSCYGNYLTASNERFLLGATGRKVVLSKPARLDSSVEWEPAREGSKMKLKTRYGNLLRANGGLPPWRNSVTHDTPHVSDSFLWDVDVVEILVGTATPAPAPAPAPVPVTTPPPHRRPSYSYSPVSRTFSEKSEEELTVPPPKSEGRIIYYHIADEEGHVEEESAVGYALNFNGNSVEQLTQALQEETSMYDVVVCTRNPLNGKLFPLRLQLPPNSGTMHVVLVPSGTS